MEYVSISNIADAWNSKDVDFGHTARVKKTGCWDKQFYPTNKHNPGKLDCDFDVNLRYIVISAWRVTSNKSRIQNN